MVFVNEAQRACYEQVAEYMRQLYGEQAVGDPERPAFYLRSGSALVSTIVAPLGEHAVVRFESFVVTEVEASYDLFEYLLRSNAHLVHGGFGIDEEHDIFFRVTLLGDTLDKDELEWALGTVAQTSDEYDDEIVSRFGGLRAVDR